MTGLGLIVPLNAIFGGEMVSLERRKRGKGISTLKGDHWHPQVLSRQYPH